MALDQWVALASSIAAFMVAMATITLVMFSRSHAKATRQMVTEMKESRELQTRPCIIAYFDIPRSIMIDLVIKNIGNGAARDVRLGIDPPLLMWGGDKDIAELPLFKDGVAFFPPSGEFRQFVGTSVNFFGKDAQLPLTYNLTASYCDVDGRPLPTQTIPLDVSVFYGLIVPRENSIDKLTKEVERLRRDFSSVIGTAYIQKGVLVKTPEDLKKER